MNGFALATVQRGLALVAFVDQHPVTSLPCEVVVTDVGAVAVVAARARAGVRVKVRRPVLLNGGPVEPILFDLAVTSPESPVKESAN